MKKAHGCARPCMPMNPAKTSRPAALHRSKAMHERIPLFEVFIRSRRGLDHKHVGSLHAESHEQALAYARDVYTLRGTGVSIRVVKSADVVALDDAGCGT